MIMKRLCIILIVFTLAACSMTHGKYMSVRETPFESVEGKAMVYIIRADNEYYNFRIWDSEELIAVMEQKSYTQIIADPGKHTYMAVMGGYYSFIEADLAPDKTYYLNSSREGFMLIPRFTVIKKGDKRWDKIAKWKKKLRRIEPIKEKIVERNEIMQEQQNNYFKELNKSRDYFIREERLTFLLPEDGV